MKEKQRRPRPLRRAVWLLSAAALLAAFGLYENMTLRVSSYTLPSALLPAAFHGLRVVQLSDLHGAQFGADNRRLLDQVQQLEPDLIALTGDLADSRKDVEALPVFLKELVKIAPTFYVTGNHEWSMGKADRQALFDLLEESGVTRLRNDYQLLIRDGQALALAGVDDPNGPADQKKPGELVQEIRRELPEGYVLMLAHRNDALPQWASLGVDTVLTGHAHGGIWDLPGLGPIFGTHMDLLPDDAEGVYRQGKTVQVVSRGLGQSNKIPFRLGNRPEITLLILEQE